MTVSDIQTDPTTYGLLLRLETHFSSLKSALVAYSGGVDSSLVMLMAHRVLGPRMLAVTAVSPSLAGRDRDAAEVVARQFGIPHRLIDTQEMDNAEYTANSPNRCYFCKHTLFSVMQELAESEGYETILDGYNADDVGDFRPGAQAGREFGIQSPLRAAGFHKREIRQAARALGLPNWNKPAAPCLASRIPYFSPVTVDGLRRIEAAEDLLHDRGFSVVRVRHHGDLARIEVPVEDLPRLFEQATTVHEALNEVGYRFVTVDLGGFRSGSMNRVLGGRRDF